RTRALHAVAVAILAVAGIAARPDAALANAPGSLCNTPSASPLCAGATLLTSDTNKIHYDLQPGTTIVSKIIGATDLTGNETCSSGPAGVDVIIKSTDFGNQTVCGTLSDCPGASCTVTFTYTAPNGPSACACNTSIVAYKNNGNTANNDIIEDGVYDGSGGNPAGFAYVDSQGPVITTCAFSPP